MEALIMEWLNLALRGVHVVAAIAWIGASFYFIWLDLSLENPPSEKRDRGVKGDLWSIHGGGIYEVSKYRLRPQRMPARLHWFKWEAYTTWLSGTALFVLMYYLQAQSYLVGTDTWMNSPQSAVVASICFIALGQLLYEALLRTPLVRNGFALAIAIAVLLIGASWIAHQLFSARAAYLHVGAMMATWMAGNVFWGIIPAQKQFVAAVEAGREPDEQLALFAKLRSTHNNYLTLPVIFTMISNHYPFLYGHDHGWIALILIGICLVGIRHFFNLKHQGIHKPGFLIYGSLAAVLIACALIYLDYGSGRGDNAPTLSESFEGLDGTGIKVRVDTLVETHCASCHADSPDWPGYSAPPAGLIITDNERLAKSRGRSLPSIESGYMPLGNLTQMTEEERRDLVAWLREQ